LEVVLPVTLALLSPVIVALSLLDLSLRSLNYYKIKAVYGRGDGKAKKLFSLLSSPEKAISVLLFSRYFCNALFYLAFGAWIYSWDLDLFFKLFLFPLILLIAILLLEYVPRMLAVHDPERTAFLLLKPFELLIRFNSLLPFPQTIERMASGILRLYGFNGQKIFSEYSVNEIKMFLSLRPEKGDGQLPKQTFDSKFFDFSGRRVREVMVPRPFVKAVEINTPSNALLGMIQENGYSRMPVYRTNLDNILGIVYARDIIGVKTEFSLETYLRRPFFVPETATVHDVFQNMRRSHTHLAIVVDEYGGVDGIVTLEDLIEELLGEIHDEYDVEEEMFQKVTENNWLLEGTLPVKELNQSLGVGLPEDPSYTTVAGFVLSILDRIPVEKQEITYGSLRFRIEKMQANKISQISIKLPQILTDSGTASSKTINAE
jgi:putative hemolysin